MIPPHSKPIVQRDQRMLIPWCWCNPDHHVDRGMNEKTGEIYRYLHTMHDDFWIYHASRSASGQAPM